MRCLWIIALFIAATGHAQTSSTIIGARAASMGNISVLLADGASLFNNIGSLAQLGQSCSFFSYEMRPRLVGANRGTAMVNIRYRQQAFGLGILRFGDGFYNEQLLVGGYSHQIGSTSLGSSIQLIQTQAQGFETKTAVSFNFGGFTRITPAISVGAYMTNITQVSFANHRVPSRLAAGIAIKPVREFLFVIEVDKDLEYPAAVRFGVEYAVHDKVFFRTGFINYPLTGSFGLGAIIKKLTMDYSLTFNRDVGHAVQASATYRFSSPRKK